jgi:hypothetical protein
MNQAEPLQHPDQDALMAEWRLNPCFDQTDEPVEISSRLCSRRPLPEHQGRVREDLAPRLANEGQAALTVAREIGPGYFRLVRAGSPAGGKQEEQLAFTPEPSRPPSGLTS